MLYLKPVQTGFPDDSDAAFVSQVAGGIATMDAHAATAASATPSKPFAGSDSMCAHTLFAWRRAASPHLAAAEEGRSVGDAEVVSAVAAVLAEAASRRNPTQRQGSSWPVSYTHLTLPTTPYV